MTSKTTPRSCRGWSASPARRALPSDKADAAAGQAPSGLGLSRERGFELLKASLGSLLVKVGATALSFGIAVVLARTLGPAGYGVYAFSLAAIMLVAAPLQTGVSHLAVRESARAKNSGESWALSALVHWTNRVAGAYFVGLVALALPAVLLWPASMGTDQGLALAMGVGLVLVLPLLGSRGSALRGHGRVVVGQLPDGVLRPGLLLLLALVVPVAAGAPNTPHLVMAMHTVAAFCALGVAHALLAPLPLRVKGASAERRAKEWGDSLKPLYLVAGLQLLNGSADVLLMGILRTDAETGIYRVVTQLAGLIVFGLAAINQILHSRFSELYASGASAALQDLVAKSVRLIVLVALPPTVLLLLAGDVVLEVVFGTEYGVGALPLRVLVVGQFANVAFGSVGALLNMTGHERDTVRGMLAAGMVNLVLNVSLIPRWGMVGAAVATAGSLVVWNAVLWRLVRVRLGIESGVWGSAGSQFNGSRHEGGV